MPSSNNAAAGMGNSATKSANVSAAPTIVSAGSTPGATLRSLGNLNGGSYTFTDTAGVALSSYSYNSANDTHTFNVNTISVGNETYSMISGTNFTSSKWTTPLVYDDGTPVLAGDAFSMSVRIDNVNTGAARQYIFGIAVIQQPTSTVIATMGPSGLYGITTSVGTPGIGVLAGNLGAGTTIASMLSAVGQVVFTGGPTMVKAGGSCAATSSTAGGSNVRVDGNTWSVPTSQQLNLAIFVSTNGTTTTVAGAYSARIKYSITKLT